MAWAEVEVPEKLTKVAPIYKGAKDNLSLVVNTGVNQKGKTTVHLILQDK